MANSSLSIYDFLKPLKFDISTYKTLASHLATTYINLAAHAQDQFLSCPISALPTGAEEGWYLSIDLGGTNLRVAFIELLGSSSSDRCPDSDVIKTSAEDQSSAAPESRVRRVGERSWPIGDHLKNEKAEDLFGWVGRCIADVVGEYRRTNHEFGMEPITMGVTFSFPMIQHTLSDATLMSMGKGFAITSNLDLRKQLLEGYQKHAVIEILPPIRIVAIANDTVATLVSFAYQMESKAGRKAAMAIIVGTGNNATIPLKLSQIHPDKRPRKDQLMRVREALGDVKIIVNTEWSINGTAPPLERLGLITKWDRQLDEACRNPGFMPFEYMTAGGYLGELGRIIIHDYLTQHLHVKEESLPPQIRVKNGLTTTVLGLVRQPNPTDKGSSIMDLERLIPIENHATAWNWTEDAAKAVYEIAKAIEARAASMTAAAVIGLLTCSGDLGYGTTGDGAQQDPMINELMVGFTGGCIVHFQSYLEDCQASIRSILKGDEEKLYPAISLAPCHDGGIVGAGILAGTVANLAV